MEQGDARKRARELSMETGDICVAATVRRGKDGKWIRGGWPSPDETWAVIDTVTGDLIEVDKPGQSYPEHARLEKVSTEINAVLEFVQEALDGSVPDEEVYRHWGIDYAKIIEERRQMLEGYRAK
jgi:hypothetical protein